MRTGICLALGSEAFEHQAMLHSAGKHQRRSSKIASHLGVDVVGVDVVWQLEAANEAADLALHPGVATVARAHCREVCIWTSLMLVFCEDSIRSHMLPSEHEQHALCREAVGLEVFSSEQACLASSICCRL